MYGEDVSIINRATELKMKFFNPEVGDFIYIHVGQVLLLYAAMLAKPWRAVPAEIYPTDTD